MKYVIVHGNSKVKRIWSISVKKGHPQNCDCLKKTFEFNERQLQVLKNEFLPTF